MHITQALPAYLAASSAERTCSGVPACIERVARELGAVHYANAHAARLNLHADAFSVRCYLGTYLPRTVFEFMSIGKEMLAFSSMRKSVPVNRPLRILDVGSGTGGAWMGLVSSLLAHGFEQGFEVDAVDGNALALSMQPDFAAAMQQEAHVPIRLTTTCRQLGPDTDTFERDLNEVLAQLGRQYDFVLVSKHLSELYCAAGAAAHGVVYKAVSLLQGVLLPKGYLIVLDMTTKIDEVGEYFPNLLARELATYLSQQPQALHPVLPLPCAVSAPAGCAGGRGQCYTQRHMHFRHSVTSAAAPRHEHTKVTYRVLTHRAQAANITAGYPSDLAYHVNDNCDNQACHRGRVVWHVRGYNGFVTPIEQSA